MGREAEIEEFAQGLQDDWYRDAVIYQLHVKSFFDSNGDGVGDFPGLIQKLDYLADLGVTALWLLPFYPSPRRDDGYDIADYCGVHPEYGSIDDVQRFIAEAHRRGLRVITELVVNHTSDQHPWFQRARKAPRGSPERDFYVWSDDDKAYSGTRIIFCDTEKSNWTWDEEAKAYYWHRFYAHQPDLNFDNPEVLKEVLNAMRFWLDLGVDGLRLDAVPYLVEREGTNNENLPETHAVLKRIRAEVDSRYQGRMLLAEANQWPEDVQQYFGDGDECHMLFHFPLMPRMYMAIAQEDRFPITDILRQTPDAPPNCQWAVFLRNHDELTLEMVTDRERDYLWETYAADKRARLNLGIRRRLSPLLQRDRRRIELMTALLVTLPGTPIIYYGDEIGMGDNFHLGDRDGVRTPMQWTPDRNGGFSRADPADLVLPAIQNPLYGYESVNVEAQQRDAHSPLNWLKRTLAVRSRHAAFGRGAIQLLKPQNRKILAYIRAHEGEAFLCVANLSGTAQAVELDLSNFKGRTPVELSGGTAFPRIGQLTYLLTLPPYGFYWFLLSDQANPPSWSTVPAEPGAEFHTFVLRDGVSDVLKPLARDVLEREILPSYVRARRWFQSKDSAQAAAITVKEWTALASDLLFAEIAAQNDGQEERYTLPLAVSWEDETPAPFEPALALSRVRKFRRVGLLTDGFASSRFVPALLSLLRKSDRLAFGEGELVFEVRSGFDWTELEGLAVEWPSAEQSNSTLMIGAQAVVKLFRRLVPGIHPEVEMTEHLSGLGFNGVAPIIASVTKREAERQTVIAVMQRFVPNQGDAFGWSVARLVQQTTELAVTQQREKAEHFGNYENFARAIGLRVGQMHKYLAMPSDNPDFSPDRVDEACVALWTERLRAQLQGASEAAQNCGKPPLPDIDMLMAVLAPALSRAQGSSITRIHGDLHLGQILVTADTVIIVDFEGEPLKSLEVRRAKTSPLRDVAGMLRSFDYAAAVAARKASAEVTDKQTRSGDEMRRNFREAAENAFLAGYEEGYGAPLTTDAHALLAAFTLEKCAYEIVYEAKNRPEWIDVPLAAFSALSAQLTETAP